MFSIGNRFESIVCGDDGMSVFRGAFKRCVEMAMCGKIVMLVVCENERLFELLSVEKMNVVSLQCSC